MFDGSNMNMGHDMSDLNDLLSHMICIREYRLTIDQVLNHSFFNTQY